jgi:hypothetical protein
MNRSQLLLLLLAAPIAACNGLSHDRPPPANNTGVHSPREVVKVSATHTAAMPLTTTTAGDLAFVDDHYAIAATARGLTAISVSGSSLGHVPSGFATIALTSTGAGPAATALAVVPAGQIPGGPRVFFLPNQLAQVGGALVDKLPSSGSLIAMDVLKQKLASTFPSAIVAPSVGSAATSLWVVDAVFGPGGEVRSYPFLLWDGVANLLTEDPVHRFSAPLEDVDGDGTKDVSVLDRLTFADQGLLGVVSFSFAAPAPKDAAGGVYIFHADNTSMVHRVVVPTTSTVTGALEFVSAVGASDRDLIVASAIKGPMFQDLGGSVAIYHIARWDPLGYVQGQGTSKYDRPTTVLHTSAPNPIGIAIQHAAVFILCAPFSGDAALDVVDLGVSPPVVSQSIKLGPVYSAGAFVPGDPRVSPDGTQVLIGTEVGLLRATLTYDSVIQ